MVVVVKPRRRVRGHACSHMCTCKHAQQPTNAQTGTKPHNAPLKSTDIPSPYPPSCRKAGAANKPVVKPVARTYQLWQLPGLGGCHRKRSVVFTAYISFQPRYEFSTGCAQVLRSIFVAPETTAAHLSQPLPAWKYPSKAMTRKTKQDKTRSRWAQSRTVSTTSVKASSKGCWHARTWSLRGAARVWPVLLRTSSSSSSGPNANTDLRTTADLVRALRGQRGTGHLLCLQTVRPAQP